MKVTRGMKLYEAVRTTTSRTRKTTTPTHQRRGQGRRQHDKDEDDDEEDDDEEDDDKTKRLCNNALINRGRVKVTTCPIKLPTSRLFIR
jgi:hypothetical protein